jgi:hypothetical protein
MMEIREKLISLVASSLKTSRSVGSESKAFVPAAGILGNFVAELPSGFMNWNPKKVPEDLMEVFKQQYNLASDRALEWREKSVAKSEDYVVAEAVLTHLEHTARRYEL